jgi:uncharacterized repeat protein (TIGR03803 family)
VAVSPPDGYKPEAGLVAYNGLLYGTTATGGAACIQHDRTQCGIVFSVSPAGIETVLHRFASYSDGYEPSGPLVALYGALFGATLRGGADGDGTIYKITPSGKFSVVHNFTGKDGDGIRPSGGLLQLNGTLYGTTLAGGDDNNGTVFQLSPTGQEHILHAFTPGVDGREPNGGLVAFNGSLWGTTQHGGTAPARAGTVFAVNPSGSYKQIYSFKGRPDGAVPLAGLAAANGILYGTTSAGGGPNSFGVVFSVTTSGQEQILHSFAGGPTDGYAPQASLLYVNGELYGTTLNGGPSNQGMGWGTVFEVSPSGQEQIVHIFQGPSADGAGPVAGLTDLGGSLYGTSTLGGNSCGDAGCGTVFQVSP